TGVGRRPTPVVFNILNIFASCMRRIWFDALLKPELARCGVRRNVPTRVPLIPLFLYARAEPERVGRAVRWCGNAVCFRVYARSPLCTHACGPAPRHPGVRTCTSPPRGAG